MANKVKKIIIIGPAHPLRGGIANFNEALSLAFTKNGIENSIVSFSYQYPSFLFPGKTQYSESKSPEGIKIYSLINSINPFSWIKTAKFIINESPDFVIVRYWLPFMAISLGSIIRLIKRKKINIIAITDNVIPHEKRIGDNCLTNYFLKKCDAFVAMSKAVLDELSLFVKTDNKKFIPHPIYNIFGEKVEKTQARKHLNLSETKRYILFFGLIRKYKGLDLLLESMALLKDMDISLIVAGEFYEDKQQYIDIIEKNDIKDSVIILDKYIHEDEVKHYFCSSDIIVQPYHNASQSGVSQIAYHFERPIIVTNVGGLAEIVPDGKVGYITSKEPSDIAKAIRNFYELNKEAEFSANAAIEKKKFEWDTMIEGILELNNNC